MSQAKNILENKKNIFLEQNKTFNLNHPPPPKKKVLTQVYLFLVESVCRPYWENRLPEKCLREMGGNIPPVNKKFIILL